MSSNQLRKISSAIVLLWIALSLAACGGFLKGGDNRHNVPLSASMHAALESIGSSPGEAMLIRIFKQEQQLEVWKRSSSGRFRLLKTYEICAFSGHLGPKFKEGDRQAPEGFYTITPGLMNPNSNYYLAFNTGFPNKYDRAHGRTGSNLMVHGDCSSSGCYAMTDASIAEIYALARETFRGGNHSFQLQIFPFRMTPQNIAANADSQYLSFWKDIKEGYDYFELTRTPPTWDVCEGQYIFNAGGGGALDAVGPCPAQTRPPALVAKMQADEMKVAAILQGAAEQEREQKIEQAAIAARGDAINSVVSGFFGNIGDIFTGSVNAVPASAGTPAPVPAVRSN